MLPVSSCFGESKEPGVERLRAVVALHDAGDQLACRVGGGPRCDRWREQRRDVELAGVSRNQPARVVARLVTVVAVVEVDVERVGIERRVVGGRLQCELLGC